MTEATSKGFALAAFAERVGCPLLPWQKEAAVRALELNEDGSYRFRTVLILVGRQSGKTTLLKVWALWRMVEDGARLVLGAAQALNVAREAWQGTVDLTLDWNPGVVEKVRYANGEQCLTLVGGARYMITAATRSAGRGLSVDMLILDEIREQRTPDAWAALSKTTVARADGQIVCISNAGDDESVVLNQLRSGGLEDRDPTLGLFEWSAPDGCDMKDPNMWAMSVPALGHTVSEDSVRSFLATDPPNVFRTEILCQHVSALDQALDPVGWAHGADPSGSVARYRPRLFAGLDMSPDGRSVVLAAAAALDGAVRVEPVAVWEDTATARKELPGVLERLQPVSLAWFPGGPANALATVLNALPYARGLTGQDANQACQGFVDLVAQGRVVHNADPALDVQVATAAKAPSGDGFRFTRKGVGNCNVLYAVAGAAHLAMAAAAVPRRRPVFVA